MVPAVTIWPVETCWIVPGISFCLLLCTFPRKLPLRRHIDILAALPLRRHRGYILLVFLCPAVILVIFALAVRDLKVCDREFAFLWNGRQQGSICFAAIRTTGRFLRSWVGREGDGLKS